MIDHVEPTDDELWAPMRRHTASRIGLGATGISQPVRQSLRFGADHAVARDAVHVPLDADALAAELVGTGLSAAHFVHSQASSRQVFLRRPDLGRIPEEALSLPRTDADVGIVIADGLSSQAVQRHAVGLINSLLAAFSG